MPSRFLIVTTNLVMAEDLRELLGGDGGQVDIVNSLEDAWTGVYDVAFFAGEPIRLRNHPRVSELYEHGTRLVVFNGETAAGDGSFADFSSLSLPFTSDDVLTLFDRLGLRLRGA